MTRRPALAVLCGLLLLPILAGPGAAEDEGASKPALDAVRGFEYRGTIRRDGGAIGTFHLAASVAPLPGAPADGPPHWRLVERRVWEEEEAESPLALTTTAWVDADLLPVAGSVEETDAWGSQTSFAWKRKGESYHVEVRSEERTPLEREAAAEDPALTTLAAFVARGRLAEEDLPAEKVHLWDPTWEYLQAEAPFLAGTLTVTIAGRWQGDPAALVEWTSETLRILVALAPETRALRGAEVHPKHGPPLVFLPGDGGAAPADDEPPALSFHAPATSPEACALRVALAFMTADVDLFDETIHWPSLRKNHPGIVKGEVSDAEFRKAIRAQFEAKKQPPQPRAEAEAFLRSIAKDLETRPNGPAAATIVLPEAFGGMRLGVAKVEDAWFLIRLPGT